MHVPKLTYRVVVATVSLPEMVVNGKNSGIYVFLADTGIV